MLKFMNKRRLVKFDNLVFATVTAYENHDKTDILLSIIQKGEKYEFKNERSNIG